MLLATLSLAACGGRQVTPVVAEPIENPPAPVAHSAPRASAVARPTPPPAEDHPEQAERPREKPKTAPPGVRHTLEPGQTLYSLARLYDVPVRTLMEANGITNPRSIRAGTPIFVPGARERRDYPGDGAGAEHHDDRGGDAQEHPAMREAGVADLGLDNDEDDEEVDHTGPPDDGLSVERRSSTHLAWPLTGIITGPYGRRGKHGHHAGIDIDGQEGDPIRAAASGVVVEAGLDGPYGRRVVIDHGDGLSTLYAHAEKLLVHPGETVHVGQRIALVGRSGNARGTHLHFEVRHDGRTVNPNGYLSDKGPLTAGVQ
ncbi:MAG TPA: M23 family metallopeptidase [Dongiaceae bacterium]|nr:M23 family metallopeptidase [Dongiaceae bacterium]